MSSTEVLEKKLAAAFNPEHLEVTDESDGCGSKFSVVLVSAKFEGVALLQRQRSVNECLAEEMEVIHALTMKTWTPAQYAKRQAKKKAAAAAPASAPAAAAAAAAPSS